MVFVADNAFELVSILYVLAEHETKGFNESNRRNIPRIDFRIELDDTVRFAKSGKNSA